MNTYHKFKVVGMFNRIVREVSFANPKTNKQESMLYVDITFELEGKMESRTIEVYREDRIASFKSMDSGTRVKLRLIMKPDEFSPIGKMNYRIFLDNFEICPIKELEPKGLLVEKDVYISPEDLALIIEDDYKHNRNAVADDCMMTRLAIIKMELGVEGVEAFYKKYRHAMANNASPSDYYR